jgi:ubiquinone/menaquinone biosynthesis C-methylase UbiE
MPDFIDYDSIADLYDHYASADYDYDFFTRRITPGMPVLELTSGTGRLSIPLIKAGAVLTCVEISQKMLNVLERKLEAEELNAEICCSDVQFLNFDRAFEIAILPFQSFMELVGREKQLNVLRSTFRALLPKGRFYCTMHNPTVRRKTVDGVLRGVGTFKFPQGTIVVSGFEAGGDPVVRRSQFIECFNESGEFDKRILQYMEFEMIEEDAFRDMAIDVGFKVKAIFGDYHENKFDSKTSPVMIWDLERHEP